VVAHAALDPIGATADGIEEPGVAAAMTDYSPDGFAARTELLRTTLTELAATTPVDERERVAAEAMAERLGLELEMLEAGIPQSQLSVIDSPLHSTREVFDLAEADTEQAWADVATRLAAVPSTVRGYVDTLREQAAQGRVTSARQVTAVVGQLAGWTRTGSAVFPALVRDAAVGSGLRSDLDRAAAGATAALGDVGTFLTDDLGPQAREVDAVGREHYALCSRYFLGAVVDLDETYHWAFDELDRIETQMRGIARTLTGSNDVGAAAQALDDDPERVIHGAEAFRDWMQERSDLAVAELGATHFDIPEPIRRLDCRIAPTRDGGIYYTGPSEDFRRPGSMWWSVPEGVDTFSTWHELTTVHHEGVPGHHLQVAQTIYRRELLNRWQRFSSWVSGHGEGWALYAEQLMAELGYLDEPGVRFGMYDSQAFRATRVIIDIGMHLQLEIPRDNPFGFHPGQRWTPELGWEFLTTHVRMDEALLRFELDRYLGWPGQAPSYKVGQRIWLEARADAKARRAADFDLREFHRQALDLGSLGLDPFRAALARL